MRLALMIAGGSALILGFFAPVLATNEPGPLVVSVTTSPNPYAIKGSTSVASSEGILALANGMKDVALEGYVTQPGSAGLEGFAQATGGSASNGVFGYATNGSGIYGGSVSAAYPAIFGDNTASGSTGIYGSGTATGIYGSTATGDGVFGIESAEGANAQQYAGVFGQDMSSDGESGVEGLSDTGTGVYGTSTSGSGVYAAGGDYGSESFATASGAIAGIFGAADNGGEGVLGVNNYNGKEPNAFTYGVEGQDNTASETYGHDAGVYGVSQNNDGVLGQTETNVDTGTAGVLGEDLSTAAGNAGLAGETTLGYGVYAAGSGSNSVGVQGVAEGSGGAGVVAQAVAADAIPLEIVGSPGVANIVEAYGGATEILKLDASGNVFIAGTLTQSDTLIRDREGKEHRAYDARGAEATIDDYGEAKLSNGHGFVPLAADFAGVIDPNVPYLVFITPESENTGYFVSSRDPRGFEVRSSTNPSMAFAYRVVARPRSSTPMRRLATASLGSGLSSGAPLMQKPILVSTASLAAARASSIAHRAELRAHVHAPRPARATIHRPKAPAMPMVFKP